MDLNSYGEKPYQIRTLARDSSQQGGLSGAVLACSGLRGSAIIIHGSPGCGWAGRWMRSDHVFANYTPIIATSILEHELIFGATDKLRKTVKWVLKTWKPRYLFIINGDTGSLINDPISDIATEFEKEYGTPIIPLDTPFFRGLEASGVDDVFSAILERFGKKEEEKKKDKINLIAPFLMGSNNWVYDLEEIIRFLSAIEISVNCILTYGTRIEDIARFNEAWANLYLTGEAFPQFNRYEEKHDLRRIGLDLPLPIGIANTEHWYLAIAKELGKKEKAEEVLKEERKALKRLKYNYNCSWLQTWLANKYAAVIGPAHWAASFANFLYYDLAAFPSVIALYGETDEAITRAKGLLDDLKNYYNPIILENPLYIQLMDAVKDANVEFAIGQSQEKSLLEGNGVPLLPLAGFHTIMGNFNFIPFPSMGLKGVLYLLTMLGRLLEQTFHETERWKELKYRRRTEI